MNLTDKQKEQIEIGIRLELFEEGVLDFINNGDFNKHQVGTIISAFEDGLTIEQVEIFAKPEIDFNEMVRMKTKILNGESIEPEPETKDEDNDEGQIYTEYESVSEQYLLVAYKELEDKVSEYENVDNKECENYLTHMQEIRNEVFKRLYKTSDKLIGSFEENPKYTDLTALELSNLKIKMHDEMTLNLGEENKQEYKKLHKDQEEVIDSMLIHKFNEFVGLHDNNVNRSEDEINESINISKDWIVGLFTDKNVLPENVVEEYFERLRKRIK